MKALVLSISVLVAACLATASLAQPALAITNPDWVKRPSAEDVGHHYPKLASRLEIEGYATISCGVSVKGRLTDCRTLAEIPGDIGFGQAALDMSTHFEMRPQTLNGIPVAGGTVRIPIRFSLPSARAAAPLPDPPTGDILVEAYRVVDAFLLADRAVEAIEAEARRIEFIADKTASKEAREAAAEAMREGANARKAVFRDSYARAYAAVFSRQELAATADFANSPASIALSKDATFRDMRPLIMREALRAMLVSASQAYCSRNPCASHAEVQRVWRALPSREGRIDNPQWIEAPDESDLRRARPPVAALLGLVGVVRMTCALDSEGGLEACTSDEEAPAGIGFGAAAVGLADDYRLSPLQLPPRAEGRKVTVRVGFTTPEPDEPFQAPPPRSEGTLALAQEFVATTETADQIQAQIQANLRIRGEQLSPLEVAAKEAFQVAAREALKDALDQTASAMAAVFTEEQLAPLVAFRNSPAGLAQRQRGKELAAAMNNAHTYATTQANAEARARYCKVRDCTLPPFRRSAAAVNPESADHRP